MVRGEGAIVETRIIVTDVFPPIPIRQFDFQAHYEGTEDEQMPAGHGATEDAAVQDLLTNFPPPCLDCDGKGGMFGIECATCEGSGERCTGDMHNPIIIISSDGNPLKLTEPLPPQEPT